jgi:hypothetical protein
VKGVRKLISDHGAGNLVSIANGSAAPARPARTAEPAPAEPAPVRAAPAPAPAAASTSQAPDTAFLDELRSLRDRLAAALAA